MPQQQLVSHINHAIPASAHTQMYLIHKWWARKPHNVVSEYIKYYSKEGEIVLDPFCGSGVTPIESIKLGRKAIGVDLNPMSIFVTRMTAIPANIDSIKKTFDEIEKVIAEQILNYYVTKCSKCNNKGFEICAIWKEGSQLPEEIRHYCAHCEKYIHKKPDAEDIQKIQKIQKLPIKYWYPKNKLKYKSGQDFKEGTHQQELEDISSLFTHRNLLSLSMIFNEINSIKNKEMKDLFRFAFTSMCHLASKMTPDRPTRPYSSFWAQQRYWIPPINMESNVWGLFESAVKGRQGLVAGKEDSNSRIKKFNEAKDFQDLQADSNILLLNQSSLDLTQIPSNSVDYVFTDPPYGGEIQYFELSTLWASWLNHDGFTLDYDGEITINDRQNKSFEFYHKMLKTAFQEVYRVLKTGKYLTVTFHNTEIEIYNSILKAAVLAGFDLEKVVYQPPARPSAKSLLQPYGSAFGDYYIRFRKPEQVRGELPDAQIDQERYERIIVDSVKKVIAERGEPTPYSYILNSYSIIYDELKKNGYLFSASDSIDSVLKKHLNKEFVVVHKKDDNGKTIARLWWFKDPSSIPFLERVPLAERVEKAIINVLNRNIQATFDDILQEIFVRFPNSLTPETSDIDYVLKEYAEQVRGGKWRLKPIVRDRENEHNKIIELICQLGEKAGFTVYGDTQERRGKLSFDVPEEKLARIREIDALWYKQGKIRYEFEVENSTGITEAIVRGTNIEYPVGRIIVIPEERDNLLSRKLKEPAIEERVREDKWLFIHYGDFYTFYDKNKRKRSLDPEELLKLNILPKTTKTDVLDSYIEK
ncbi:MAG: DNA methyltransferase [Nitrososphaerota archaeon]